MKKFSLSCTALALLCSANIVCAAPKGEEVADYRRNSLNFIMLDVSEGDAEVADLVRKAFTELVVPAKYNDHNVDAALRSFDFSSIEITDADREAYEEATGQKKKSGGGLGALKAVGGAVGVAMPEISPVKKNSPVAAWKYLKESNMACEMFCKWFVNPENQSELSVDLLRERANFNATETEKLAVAGSARGVFDQIADDAGYELLNNTFTAVTRLRYMSGQDMYDEIMETGAIAAALIPVPQAQSAAIVAATAAAEAAKAAIGDGYVIYSTTYLYQLVWNDDVQNAVEEKWTDVEGFKKLDCFKLQYVGSENAYANVLGKKFPKEQAVKLAVNRTMEKVLAKLERKYEVFRTKTPLTGIEPLTADIGTKECVEKDDKYEVLEKSIDKKTNKPVYKRKGLLVVDVVGNNITDGSEEIEEGAPTQTTFKGNAKGLYTGMLLRQTTK